MWDLLRKLLKDETGTTGIEYAIVAAFVAVAAISALGNLGTEVANTFNAAAGAMEQSLTQTADAAAAQNMGAGAGANEAAAGAAADAADINDGNAADEAIALQ